MTTRSPISGSGPPPRRRGAFLTPLTLVLAGLSAYACAEGPVATGVPVDLPLAVSVAADASGAIAAAARPLNEARLTVHDVDDDAAPIVTRLFELDPDAIGWSFSLSVPLEGSATRLVVVTIELIHLDAAGNRTVEFSGRSPPLLIGADRVVQQVPRLESKRGPTDNIEVTRVTVEADSLTVDEGKTLPLGASLEGGGENARVFWATTDESVATVDSAGVVTGHRPGTAGIIAAAGSASDTAVVTVLAVPSRLEVEPDSMQLTALGAEAMFSAALLDVRGDPVAGEVVWSVADEAVAENLGDGRFRALGNGSTLVTAHLAQDPELTGQAVLVVAQEVASVTVTPDGETLTSIGETLPMSAVAVDELGNPVRDAPVEWRSSDEGVATVDSGGRVTAVGPGDARIIATVQDVEGSAAVEVAPEPVALVLDPDEIELLAIGESLVARAILVDAGGNELDRPSETTWSVADPEVASVDGDGLVTATGLGTTTLRAEREGLTAEAPILVRQVVDRVELRASPDSLFALGAVAELEIRAFDAAGVPVTGFPVELSVSDPQVLEIRDRTAVALANGQAEVTATVDEASASVSLVVEQRTAEVRVTPESAELDAIRASTRLEAAVVDAGGTPVPGVTVSWASDAPGVAHVESDGTVTALSPGSASVTASAGGFSASASVAVRPTPHSVAVSPTEGRMDALGETLTFSAEVRDRNGFLIADAPLSWSAAPPGIIALSDGGVATALAPGEAAVRAESGPAAGEATVLVDPTIASFEIDPGVLTLTALGETSTLVAVALDGGGTPVEVSPSWSSSAPDIVAVDDEGRITAVAQGAASVTATAQGMEASAEIVVDQLVDAVTVEPSSLALTLPGGSGSVTAQVLDALGNPVADAAIDWTTSAPEVAAVTPDGRSARVDAVAQGTATVTATSEGVAATVPVTVTGADNDAPTAVAQRLRALAGEPTTVTLAGTDPDGDPLTFAIEEGPANGVLTGLDPAGGTVVYTAAASFQGTDRFTFRVSDGASASEPAEVEIEVALTNGAPTAIPGTVSTTRNTPVVVDLVGSDPDSDPLTFSVIQAPANGTLGAVTLVDASTARVTYTPEGGFAGEDTLTFSVSDGLATSAPATMILNVTQPIAVITLTPATTTLTALDATTLFTALVQDPRGSTVPDPNLKWSTSDPGVATVEETSDTTALVTAVGNGTATITVQAGNKSASATVVVSQAVESVEVVVGDPGARIDVGEEVPLTANPVDANGHPVPGRSAVWTSSDVAVVTVVPTGDLEALAKGQSQGSAEVTATVAGVASDPVRITVTGGG